MSDRNDKILVDYLLEAYQKTGLTRRRFLRRLGLQITGVGALVAALSKTAKGCCGSCNAGCNACNSCNAFCNSCNIDICEEESDSCLSDNVCNYDGCISVNTCHKMNTCHTNRCELSDVCTTNTCDGDSCPATEDICGVNTCGVNTCKLNICQEDDCCFIANRCAGSDVDCGTSDISCPIANWTCSGDTVPI
jgi:hypothetical protein